MKHVYWIFALVSIFVFNSANAQDTLVLKAGNSYDYIGNHLSILEAKDQQLSLSDVLKTNKWVPQKFSVPSLPPELSTFWLKLNINNGNLTDNPLLVLEYATIDSITFYCVHANGAIDSLVSGEYIPFYKRNYHHQNYFFPLNIKAGENCTIYVKLKAQEPIQLPLKIGEAKPIMEETYTNDIIFALYAGIILVMFLYNIFVFFSVRDRAYLYYVGYILFTGLTQACLQGYAPRYFYPNSEMLANAMVVWIPALSGIFSILFINHFLQVKKHAPLFYTILNVFLGIYGIVFLISLTGKYLMATSVMQLAVTILALVVYVTAVKIALKGYRPAKIFLIAWSVFIVAVVIFVMRSQGVLPYNSFTFYAMQIGSAVEVVMLSFALADRINIFRKEKEESQAQALAVSLENERIIKEQNIVLERKVDERTQQLKESNIELEKTLHELKEAESQLVESEKMASLGQLTAGIAHEINNPINFVTSNVKPLNRDVKILLETVDAIEKILVENAPEKKKEVNQLKEEIDYDYLKIEIDQLLNGISDGASRTAEIVKGLRIFSRLDEDTLKRADINEGMVSTLVISNNLLGSHIQVNRKFGNLPLIECYPGKLNQVFLNMISNAVYAIRKRHDGTDNGILSIETYRDEDFVYVVIEDNGTGMDENTKKKLFEPFFTTKEVGEGTGLGLSIAYNTINKHNGQINIESKLGEGTKFTIKLPILQN